MVEVEWLIETLGEMLDSVDDARMLVRKYAAEVRSAQSGMIECAIAYSLLDAMKRQEPGLAATAASTLKVRIMMLITVRGQLTTQPAA